VPPSPRRRDVTLARWVSILGHPFVMTALWAGGAAVRLGDPRHAARTLALVAFFAVLPVAILMVRQVRRGAWENVDASNVGERPVLYLVAALGLLALLAYLLVADPGSFLVRGVVGGLAMVALCASVTPWVKVSLHVAFAALAATSLVLFGFALGWLMAVLVPALAWSRLTLTRHRPLELVLGLLIGVATGLALHLA
jgi:hypothetical protein